MPLTSCLICQQSLQPADQDYRYCPHCGAIRVLPDPPNVATPADRFIVVGNDAVGTDGRVYVYQGRNEVPVPLDPLSGDHLAPGGGAWPDLVASRDTPYPETAIFSNDLPKGFPHPAKREFITSQLSFVAIRHTRIFALAKGAHSHLNRSYQLQSFDTRTCDYADGWFAPDVTVPVSALCDPVSLQVSETLVYSLVTMPAGKTLLYAYDIGTGRLRIQMSISGSRPRVLIAGGLLLVITAPPDDNQEEQTVLVYPLSAWKDDPRANVAPCANYALGVASAVDWALPQPVLVGSSFVVVAADGKVYALDVRNREVKRPRLLWPNPQRALIWEKPLPLSGGTLGLVSEEGQERRACRVFEFGPDPDGRTTQVGALDLPLLNDSRTRSLAAWNGALYAVVHPPGQNLILYRFTRQRDPSTLRGEVVLEFDATPEAILREFLVFPYKGGHRLFVHYLARGDSRYPDRYLVEDSGKVTPIEGRPSVGDNLVTLWQTNSLWSVNLTKGQANLVL